MCALITLKQSCYMETHHSDPIAIGCLNCNTETHGKYCHECGQKTGTHRITLSHFITHDLVHGVWHLDKGLLFTLKESVLRPGYMAVNYIRGSRAKYYNVFYLALLVIGLNVLVSQYFHGQTASHESPQAAGIVIEKDTVDISYYINHYFKLLLFLLVPFFAFAGLRSFKRLNFNFAEHAIIGGHLLLTGTLWSFVLILVMQAAFRQPYLVLDYVLYGLLGVLFLLPVRIYYQATRTQYKLLRFLIQVVLWYVWFFAQVFMVMVVIAILTGKTNIKL